ncbi:hypothetical protein RJ639_003492 [Escallonia herrerae]|uniref:NAD(P)-binding domain-containing protein n=1 Tax=Escallonia herrerae TaxID=1293975 RepID=A0AA88W3E0_9ASTE|nr:hypothetical protein RJ639_003492 [Escallonia herrerae]
MAPTLTSNSFPYTTTPHTRPTLKNQRLTVFAKNAGPFSPFRLGKSTEDSSSEEDQAEKPAKSGPFRFDFGKLPDVKALIPVVTNPTSGLSFNQRRKDPGTVFVAGATGQAGVRISQMLLREGFSVRAGVSELGAAQELARFAATYKIISIEESKRFNAVQSSFQDAESIAKAIGNASKVVVTIGPAENGPTTEVTPSDALQVIEAAQLAGVGHVAVVYDASTNGSTYNVLDGISSFFGNLFNKSQPLTFAEFLEKMIETDVRYTLIKTKLTEDFSPESSYNIVVSAEGSGGADDYKVIFPDSAIRTPTPYVLIILWSLNLPHVVEVFTDPSAPSRPIDELFSAIPEDGRRKALAEALAKAKAEEEAIKATEKAREAAEAAKKLEEEVKKLEQQEVRAASLAEEAQEKAAAAGAPFEGIFDKAKDLSSGLSWDKLSSQLASAVPKPSEKPKVQIATVRGQAKASSLPAKKAVVKQTTPKLRLFKAKDTKAKEPEPKAEVRKVFGGLFQQQTIYVDDD